MSISLHECFAQKYLSKHLEELIKLKYPKAICLDCQEPLYMNDNLDQLYCANKNCLGTLTQRLYTLGKAFPLENWNLELCRELIQTYHLTSPFQITTVEIDEDTNEEVAMVILQLQMYLQQRILSSADLIALSGIPFLSSISHTLFKGYPNLTDFYAEIEFGEIPYIAQKIGLEDDLCIYAATIYEQLIKYKEDLLEAESYFIDNYTTNDTIYITFCEVSNTLNTLDIIHQLELKHPYINIVAQGILTPLTVYFVSSMPPNKEQSEFCKKHNIEHLYLSELDERLESIM